MAIQAGAVTNFQHNPCPNKKTEKHPDNLVNLRVGAKRKSRHKRGHSETNLSACIMEEIPTS